MVPAELTEPQAAPTVPGVDADTADLARFLVDLKAWGARGWSRVAVIREHYGSE